MMPFAGAYADIRRHEPHMPAEWAMKVLRGWCPCCKEQCEPGTVSYVVPMTMHSPDRRERRMQQQMLHGNDFEDPNEVGFMCQPCAEQYNEYWQERWDDYNSGRM